jgi:hypothetical protein
MWREWPFFRAMLSNLDMLLAKTDLTVAARYKDLFDDTALADKIFALIRGEFESTVEALFGITGSLAFLASNPSLARSIRNRFPYLDPLNHLQIELLKRHRAGAADDRVKRGIHLSINGLRRDCETPAEGGTRPTGRRSFHDRHSQRWRRPCPSHPCRSSRFSSQDSRPRPSRHPAG